MTRDELRKKVTAFAAAVRAGHRPDVARAVLRPGARRATVVPLPCVHRGDRLPGEPCGSTLYGCRLRGSCSVYTPCEGAAAVCRTCPDRRA